MVAKRENVLTKHEKNQYDLPLICSCPVLAVTLNKQQMRQQPSIGFERLDFLTLNIRTPYHAVKSIL